MGMAAILVMWPGPFEQAFFSPIQRRLHMKFDLIGLVVSKEKQFENIESEWPWTKVNEWPWLLIFM